MQFDLTGPVVDRAAAWRVVTDTDWMNRVAGHGRVLSLDVALDDHDYPRVTGALAGPLGMPMTFFEDDNSWVHQRYFRQGRTFQRSPVSRSFFEARLEPVAEGPGVIPHIRLELVPASILLAPAVRNSLRVAERAWRSVLEALPAPAPAPAIPPRDVRVLGGHAAETLTRWSGTVDPTLADALARHLRTARPLELQQMRPYELADRWGLDREAALGGFLRGVQSGLLELYWSVRCPRCNSQNANVSHLSNLADHAECASCRLQYVADLATHVEALFAAHPSVAKRVDESFCTLFPQGSPTILASFILTPGEHRKEEIPLTEGSWRIGSGGQTPDAPMNATADGAVEATWAVGDQSPLEVAADELTLTLVNAGTGRARVQIGNRDVLYPSLSASRLTTLPVFRRTMSDQVLSTTTRISTRSVTLVFTDLTDSTAMYEELGDAAAYALVRDHFIVLNQVIEDHQGVVVKTIGDAVMAAFDEPAAGIRAACALVEAMEAFVAKRDLSVHPQLKIGMHSGPALVVHTDASGLDFFGGTVNLAARAQGVAGGGELVLTDTLRSLPSAQAAIADNGLEFEVLQARLKGLEGDTRLHRARVHASRTE